MRDKRTVDVILGDASKTSIEKMEEIKNKNLSNDVAEGFLINLGLKKITDSEDFINFSEQVILDNTVSIYTLFYMLRE